MLKYTTGTECLSIYASLDHIYNSAETKVNQNNFCLSLTSLSSRVIQVGLLLTDTSHTVLYLMQFSCSKVVKTAEIWLKLISSH